MIKLQLRPLKGKRLQDYQSFLMSSIDEIRNTRLKKLELLQQEGFNPYPAHTNRELKLSEAEKMFGDLEKSGDEKWLAGRVMSVRGQGAIIFVTLYDGTAFFSDSF